MRSEDTGFSGGPLDGRSLPVPLGPTGRPPRSYEIPVPDPDGGAPTVHTYRLEPARVNKWGIPRGWTYIYEGEGRTGGGPLSRLPWRRRGTRRDEV